MTALGRAGSVLDAVIVGQGLAGTTLAWHLIERGLQIAVIDDGAPVSASKVSAGLLTPIMGRRFTPNDPAAIANAKTFYRRIQGVTGATFLRDIRAVRLFASDADRALWQERRDSLRHHLTDPQPDPLLPVDVSDTRLGGFAMPSAQLDVAEYLAASRRRLSIIPGHVAPCAIDTSDPTSVRLGDLRTKRLVFCDGFAGAANPYFPGVPYRSAKGDILIVRLSTPLPATSVHRAMWMAPMAEPDMFRVGATFSWSTLDTVPTAEGRAAIEAELRAHLVCRYSVVDHFAAVRPIIRRGPRIGPSRIDTRILMFNGLGTKGATRAPGLARLLAAHMCDGAGIPPALDPAAPG